ncbi:MAG: [protein-PII] uridylyltransferase, partial [Actinomycetes bacterium]
MDAASVRYAQARRELLEQVGRPGPDSRRALVVLTDDWLADLFVASGAADLPCALVAVGGYGRANLAPGSDLDLLLLHQKGADVSAVAERIWYPVWDGGMRLDHSVRTPAEARKLAGQDIKVVLGLLDARTVAGDSELTTNLRAAVLTDWRASAHRRLADLRLDVDERAERNGELAHLLEPDLKESYGGLRDLTVLRAIGASWLVDARLRSLESPTVDLLDARDALHLATGRAGDRLTLQEQGPAARILGDESADILLRRVSAAGRAIGYVSDEAWHRVDRLIGERRRIPVRFTRSNVLSRAPLTEGVVVQDGDVVLAADARPDRDPVLVLRAAAAAAQAGLRLSPYAVERLASESAPMPIPWPPAARDALVSLLGAGKPAIPVWEALEQQNVISALIPQWEVVRSAPQRNPVHRFTVDRHLVETAVNASGRMRSVARPDLLVVGALLHDIGKGQGGDHTEVGIRIVTELAPRMGFDPQDSAVLVSVVRNHLLLPDTATRRDLTDPATAQMVADAVQTTEVLDLLEV